MDQPHHSELSSFPHLTVYFLLIGRERISDSLVCKFVKKRTLLYYLSVDIQASRVLRHKTSSFITTVLRPLTQSRISVLLLLFVRL
nr:MAG TPA: hypothetical protein [Caudoviricetes sp.]